MLKIVLFLNDIINVILGIIENTQRLALRNIITISNFVIDIFTLEPKLSESYLETRFVYVVHMWRRQHMRVWRSPISTYNLTVSGQNSETITVNVKIAN